MSRAGRSDRGTRLRCRAAIAAALLASPACRPPAPPAAGGASAVPVPAIPWNPRAYVAYRAPAPPVIDGRLDDSSWERAAWTDDFTDILGPAGPTPRFRTRAKLLWDSVFLYVAAQLEEPDLWANLVTRDAVIFRDNDFEVFLDPDGDTHNYYELEINAHGTVWDLFLAKPYRDGGPALNGWDVAGLESAVALDGTLNRPGDTDHGWTVELGLPWSALREAAGRPAPPGPGDQWRINFSRVEWTVDARGGTYVKRADSAGRPLPEANWVWSPQGVVNMHYPEMWGTVQFATDTVGGRRRRFEPDPRGPARWALRRVYYAERAYHERFGVYSADPTALGVAAARVAPVPWPMRIVASPTWFQAFWIDGRDTIAIGADGRTR